MSEPVAVLADLRRTLGELDELLTEHREFSVLPGVRNLRALADSPEPATDALPQIDRAYWQLMGIPDGLSGLYFPAAGGGVDREATRRLDDLRARMVELLKVGRGEAGETT